jgi:glyoxylase-like metal-dependent hydrolase (beta-lactamase superfamily II)
MRTRRQGKVQEGLWSLGREESCVYLLEGSETSMMVSGGMSYIVSDLLEQFRVFKIDERRITKQLILHAHFDHLGVIPFLTRRNPDLRVYGSARAWELLGTDKVIMTINQFSRDVAKRMGREDVYESHDLDWDDKIIGQTVSEGEVIDLGNLSVRILETPGHSTCSITAYVPEMKVLFASDGGGIPYKDRIIASGNSNFTKYQESLERLKELDVEIVCADHYGYITGDDARRFIGESIESAKRERALIEETYRKTRDIETAAHELTEGFYRGGDDYLIAPEIFEGVYRQMVRHIAGVMEDGPRSQG